MTTYPLFPRREASLRKRLLLHFFTHSRARLYLREIAAQIQGDPANLCRLLRALEKEGIFVSEKRGLQKYFSLNRNYPLYEELKSILSKTAGLAPRAGAAKVYIVAGPNGAGKTTFAQKFLPHYVQCQQFVNADLIAGGLSPFSPDQSAIQAGRLLLERIRTLATKRINFGFETTLAGKSYQNLFTELKTQGYALHLFFLWIPNVELAISRIADRVKRGGHAIPEPVVRRQFKRGIWHLFELYRPILKTWSLFDNSGSLPHLVAGGTPTELKVLDKALFDRMAKKAGVEIK